MLVLQSCKLKGIIRGMNYQGIVTVQKRIKIVFTKSNQDLSQSSRPLLKTS